MSEGWSDAELIRICLESSPDELTDEVVAALQSRLADSLLIRDAVRESPHAALLEQRLVFEPESKPPSLGKAFAVLALLAIGAGVALWFRDGPNEPQVKPDEVARDDDTQPEKPPRDTIEPTGDQQAATADSDASPDSVAASDADTPTEAPDDPGTNPETPAPKETDDTATAAVVDPESDEPWAELLNPDNAPLRFEDIAWRMPRIDDIGEFPASEFREWVERIPGRPYSVSDHKHGNKRFTYLDGMGRLRAPWVEDAVLRLAIYDATVAELYFWNGNDGLRLRLYRTKAPQRWAVHRVVRRDEKSPPEIGELLITDCGRWHRSYFGPFDIRFEGGQLLLTRGSVRLLSAPCEKPPEEVVLSGKMRIRQMFMFRSDPVPDSIVAAGSKAPVDAPQPIERNWTVSDGPGVKFRRITEAVEDTDTAGAIELASTSEATEVRWASTPVVNPGLSEFIFRIAHADPGTGIYLGDFDGKPLYRLNIVWDPVAKRTGFLTTNYNQDMVESRFNLDNDPAPWIGPTQWVRVTLAAGNLTTCISPDGVHWGRVGLPQRVLRARWGSIGIFATKGGDRRIQLSHASTRELPEFKSLAAADTVARVDMQQFAPIDMLDTGAWLHRVLKTRPPEVDTADWRRACSVASLRAVPSPELQLFLINGLLADALFNGEAGDTVIDNTDDRAWRLLSEAARLTDVYDASRATHLTHLWHEVTRLLARQMTDPQFRDSHTSPTLTSMEALLQSEFDSTYISPLTAQHATALELAALVEAGDQDARVFRLVDRLAFWNTNSHPSHAWWSPVDPVYTNVVWAELAAHRSLSGDEQAERLSLPFRWKTVLKPNRQSLAQRVSKEAYNVMAEFQAAIDGNAFNDACQIIASSATAELLGLLPDGQDRRLLVSFPNAVALAMDRYPLLRSSMNERFGQVGRLRVRQAMESGDASQIESATVQFYGTIAAAESELWLGDRALAAGQFTEARSHYQRALEGFRRNSLVDTVETKGLATRLRLVGSLIGVAQPAPADAAQAESVPVSFAGQELTADQFKALLTELAARTASQSSGNLLDNGQSRSSTGLRLSPRLPEIAGYKTEVRGRYEGDMGDRAGQSAPAGIDWVARQLTIEVDGTEAILTNRFQVTSIDLNTGLNKWRRDLGGDHGYAHQWAMLPMRPVLTSNAIFCRWITKQGIELVRVNRADGNIMWRQKPPQQVASDPMLVRGRLVAFAVEQQYAGPRVLTLLTLHPETGTVLNSVPVLQMFDAWPNATQICQAAANEGRLYATVAGLALCCDAYGQTLWVRRRDAMDPALDNRYRYTRTWVPPLIDGDRLIVTQPECPTVECLDIETGRMLWQHVSLGLQRIVALTDGRLMTQTRSGLECLDAETGQPLWLYPAADLLDGIAVLDPPEPPADPADETPPPEAGLLITRRVHLLEGRKNMFVPTLVWLNAETGHEVARQMLQPLVDTEPFVGPILVTPEKQWLFFAKNRKTPQREIRELIRDETLSPVSTQSQQQWSTWHPEFRLANYTDTRQARPHLTRFELPWAIHRALEQVSPGWMLIAGPQPKEAGLRPDHRGQKNALALLSTPRALTEDQLKQLGDSPVDAVRLIHEVTLPQSSSPVLKFKAGHDAAQNWTLTVDADGTRIYSALVNDETAPNGWQSAHIPLNQFAGKTVRLVVTASPTERKQTWIYLSEFSVTAN